MKQGHHRHGAGSDQLPAWSGPGPSPQRGSGAADHTRPRSSRAAGIASGSSAEAQRLAIPLWIRLFRQGDRLRCPRRQAGAAGALRAVGIGLVATLAVFGLAVGLLLPARPLMAAEAPQHWTLSDAAGQRWGLALFEQPDPAYPSGFRLRLNALEPGLALDHQRPLLLDDGGDHRWQLPNRSTELVATEGAALPPGSAQFDTTALVPAPSAVQPLRLQVPLADGEADAAETTLMLGAGPTEALSLSVAQP